MGNVSVYLPDDLHEWANDNIKNLSSFTQDAVVRKKQQMVGEIEAVKRNKYFSLLIYFAVLLIGVAVLVFSYVLHTSTLGTISVSYEVIVFLLTGMALLVLAIFMLFQHKKNGVKQ